MIKYGSNSPNANQISGLLASAKILMVLIGPLVRVFRVFRVLHQLA